jgi:hypothetical protein
MNRLPSGGIATPTRPLARMMKAPTTFSSSPASANRPTLPPIRAPPVKESVSRKEENEVLGAKHSNGTPKKESQLGASTSPPPPSRIDWSGYSPKLLRSPGKSARLTSVFDTPSKSSGKGFLSSPNRMRGLGLFVSPGKSVPRSPSKTATPRAPVEPVLDEDITPKATLVNPKFRPGSRRPLTELSAMQKEADGGVALMKAGHIVGGIVIERSFLSQRLLVRGVRCLMYHRTLAPPRDRRSVARAPICQEEAAATLVAPVLKSGRKSTGPEMLRQVTGFYKVRMARDSKRSVSQCPVQMPNLTDIHSQPLLWIFLIHTTKIDGLKHKMETEFQVPWIFIDNPSRLCCPLS